MKPSYIDFDNKEYQKKLQTYSTKSETGVLSYPYSKKISKYWRFKTPEEALTSAQYIYNIFLQNIDKLNDIYYRVYNKIPSKQLIDLFIKADICRKFLQMGYTRSMRYYYHKSGKKWSRDTKGWFILPYDYDYNKKKSALIFKKYWKYAIDNKLYIKLLKYFNNLDNKYKRISM